MTKSTSGGCDQFETSPEAIDQELRTAFCERRQTDLRQIIVYIDESARLHIVPAYWLFGSSVLFVHLWQLLYTFCILQNYVQWLITICQFSAALTHIWLGMFFPHRYALYGDKRPLASPSNDARCECTGGAVWGPGGARGATLGDPVVGAPTPDSRGSTGPVPSRWAL